MPRALDKLWLSLVAQPVLSRQIGRVADLRLPQPLMRWVIEAFVRKYDINVSEAARPVDEFKTLNDFFTRRLKKDARPIAKNSPALCSPADGRVVSSGPIRPDLTLSQIKGIDYPLHALLGERISDAQYRRGHQVTLYLSPRDYHRVHAPVAGTLLQCFRIGGDRYPVNPAAQRTISGLYSRNERVLFEIQTETFGRVTVVMVGAANVSRITSPFMDLPLDEKNSPGTVLNRGDEIGTFNLGSTVVILFERMEVQSLLSQSDTYVLMGQPFT